MELILCHLLGDYVLQSDWMAMNKARKTIPCLVHCILYTIPFLLITQDWKALLFIFGTHFLIDRFPIIVKRLIWFKNHINPKLAFPSFEKCKTTGYFDNLGCELGICRENRTETVRGIEYQPRINYITIWLYIITDNFLHLACNYFAVTFLT